MHKCTVYRRLTLPMVQSYMPALAEAAAIEDAGVLWESVLLCCALSCSGVDLQRTSRERSC
jgi:hypothetical protein